jgi:hypothetical protein
MHIKVKMRLPISAGNPRITQIGLGKTRGQWRAFLLPAT